MSWEVVRLGGLLKNRDLRFKPSDPKIKGLKRIEKIDFSGNIYLSDKPSNTDMILVKKGDLVISGINVEKGAMAVYQGDNDITATIHYSSYEFDATKIDLDFLKSFLKSKKFTQALKEQVPGGIKTEIKPKHILPLEVEIPTEIEEQKIIIKKFESKKVKVESIDFEHTHQLDFLRRLRQQILQDAIQGNLVPQDPNDEPSSVLLERIKAEKERLIREKKIKKEKPLPPISSEEIPFEIPKNWVWSRFNIAATIESNLVDPFKYPNHPHVAPDNIEKGTGKLMSFKTVKEDNVISANHYFFPSQLIYSKVRPRLNKVVRIDFEGLCSADMYPLKPLINPDYLLYCMLSSYFLSEVNKFDNRVKMPKINQNQLSQILIPIPPDSEQKRIVAKIAILLKRCDELEQTIQQNQKYTQELLQVALKEALEPKN